MLFSAAHPSSVLRRKPCAWQDDLELDNDRLYLTLVCKQPATDHCVLNYAKPFIQIFDLVRCHFAKTPCFSAESQKEQVPASAHEPFACTVCPGRRGELGHERARRVLRTGGPEGGDTSRPGVRLAG